MELQTESLDKIAAWANGDNTGRSSMFMAMSAVADINVTPVYWPEDPADFRRCFELTRCLSSLERKALLVKLAAQNEKWGIIKENWEGLVQLYRLEMGQERAPDLYKFMKAIGL